MVIKLEKLLCKIIFNQKEYNSTLMQVHLIRLLAKLKN